MDINANPNEALRELDRMLQDARESARYHYDSGPYDSAVYDMRIGPFINEIRHSVPYLTDSIFRNQVDTKIREIERHF